MKNETPLFSFVLIARNESKTLPRFMASVRHFCDAGGKVYVMDTGSTDGTADLARSLGCVVEEVGSRFLITVDRKMASGINNIFAHYKDKRKVIEPGDTQFDYSSARNHAATLSHTDFIFTPDCDEAFTTLDINAINTQIRSGAGRLEYNFVFSHNADGTPNIKFLHSKAYDRTKMKWVGVIHEVLSGACEGRFVGEDVAYLEHFQNHETDRSHYLRGLAIDCFLNKDNDRNSHYFGRELMFRGFYHSAINELKRHVAMDKFPAERSQSMVFIGDCHYYLGNTDIQAQWYDKAVKAYPNRREAWLRLAEWAMKKKDYQLCASYARAALDIPYESFYANNANDYQDAPYRYLYLAYGYMGRVPEALEAINKCLDYKPLNRDYGLHYHYYATLPDVVVILPTVKDSRPEGLQNCIDSIKKQTYPQDKIRIVVMDGSGTVPQKVNKAVSASREPLIVYAADDMEFSENDFIHAYRAMRGSISLSVFDTGVRNDSGYICEHFMADRDAVLSVVHKGQLFFEGFNHVGCDDFLWLQCDQIGYAVIAPGTKTKHHHWSRGGVRDAVTDIAWNDEKVQTDRALLDKLVDTYSLPLIKNIA